MPEIELRGNSMDPIWILAVMTFPNDEDLRRQFYAVKYAESLLEGTAPTDFLEMQAGLIRDLINAPGKSELLEIVGKHTRDAIVAGNALTTVYAMDSFPNYFDEPSERKAIFVAKKFSEKSQYGDGSAIPRSDKKIRQCMENFRSVAHFWAAMTLHEGFPIRERKEILASPEAVHDFLGIAGTLQDFGSNFLPTRQSKNDKESLLDLNAVWSVPTSTKRLIPPWTAPPPWLIEAMQEYKAPKIAT
jgi:hypothetical protein